MNISIRVAPLLAVLLLLCMMGLSACAGQSRLLSNVGATAPVFSPNGDGDDDFTEITYTLGRSARVSIEILDGAGKRYPLGESLERVAGSYVARFNGAVAIADDRLERRLLTDGTYQFRVRAADEAGQAEEQAGQFTIQAGDVEPLVIRDLTTDKPLISPNGDAENDETKISYTLTKAAEVSVYTTSAGGEKTILEAPTKRGVGPATHHWNGTFGNRVMADGEYQVHVRAVDKSGNVAEAALPIRLDGGGKPQVEITSVEFAPVVVPKGGYLNVTIRVKNTGNTTIKTLGPAPGTEYSTDQTFNFWTDKLPDGSERVRYFERPGVWRVAVGWNLAGRPYPVRWALTAPTIVNGEEQYPALEPGQEATIQGRIKILYHETEELYVWAGVEQGGVGFPGGDRGLKRIRVSY